MKHINNYDAEVNYYNKKPLNKEQYYNFYHGDFNFRNIENISLTQQAYITNNITETNNQTVTYVEDKYLNNNKIATIVVNPTPSLTENYLWIPETSDNVVPGLDSLLTYIQPKYATLTALHNSITNTNHTINTEMQTLQTEISNIKFRIRVQGMSVNNHITIRVIQFLCISEIPLNTATEDNL